MNLKNKMKYLFILLPILLINISNESFVIVNEYGDESLMTGIWECKCGGNCTHEWDCQCNTCKPTSSGSRGPVYNRVPDVPTEQPSGMVGSGADYQTTTKPQKCQVPGTVFNKTMGYCVELSDNNLNDPNENCMNRCFTRNGIQSCGSVLHTTGINTTCIWYSVDAPTSSSKKNNKNDETVGSPNPEPERPVIPGTVGEISTKEVKEVVASDGCTGSYTYAKTSTNDTYQYQNVLEFPSTDSLGLTNVKKVILMSYVDPNITAETKIVKYACSLESSHSINLEVDHKSLSKVKENEYGSGTGIGIDISVTAGSKAVDVVGYGLADDLINNPTSRTCPKLYYKIELNDGSIVEDTVDHPACKDNKQTDLRKMCGYNDDGTLNTNTVGSISITENGNKTDFSSMNFTISNTEKFKMPVSYIDILSGKVMYGDTYSSDNPFVKKIDDGYYISSDAKTGKGNIIVNATTKYTTENTNPKVEYTIEFNVSCPFDIINRTTDYDPDPDDEEEDDNNGMGYYYRPISVDSIFEHRVPANSTIEKLKEKIGSNWERYYFNETDGYTELRERIGNTYSDNAKYVIRLTNETINAIRDYNDEHNYLDMELGEDGSSVFLSNQGPLSAEIEKPTSTTGSIGGANAAHYKIGCGPLNTDYTWCAGSGSDNQ